MRFERVKRSCSQPPMGIGYALQTSSLPSDDTSASLTPLSAALTRLCPVQACPPFLAPSPAFSVEIELWIDCSFGSETQTVSTPNRIWVGKDNLPCDDRQVDCIY